MVLQIYKIRSAERRLDFLNRIWFIWAEAERWRVLFILIEIEQSWIVVLQQYEFVHVVSERLLTMSDLLFKSDVQTVGLSWPIALRNPVSRVRFD